MVHLPSGAPSANGNIFGIWKEYSACKRDPYSCMSFALLRIMLLLFAEGTPDGGSTSRDASPQYIVRFMAKRHTVINYTTIIKFCLSIFRVLSNISSKSRQLLRVSI